MKTLLAVVIVLVLVNLVKADCGGAATSCSGSVGGSLVLRRTPIRNVIAAFAERASMRAAIRRDIRTSRLSSCGGVRVSVSCSGTTASCGGALSLSVEPSVRIALAPYKETLISTKKTPAVPVNCPNGICPIQRNAILDSKIQKHL